MSKNRFFNHKSPRNSAKLVRKFSNIRLIWASIQAKNTKKAKKVEIFLDKKNPTARVLMLEHSTWFHSIGNFPENFLGLFGGFGDRYKAYSVINPGQKH